jgi:hypothetical protein
MQQYVSPWSDAVITRLFELRQEDTRTLGQIAEMLSKEFNVNITRNALLAKLYRLSQPLPLKRSMVLLMDGMRVSIAVERIGETEAAAVEAETNVDA